ncbi:8-oxo-dGTP diphosphatase [Lactobacillus psittaci]|nr:8-oxo-dGTP diphosphatase [Lactobacillus psittaci]
MDRSEKVVLTNMCMVYDGSKILVENRVKKDWPGVTFPGGHVEHGESIVNSTVREVKEETGLDIKDLKICGVKQFFDDDIRTIVFLFKTNHFAGKLQSSREGEVFWIERKDLENYQLADGFASMLEIFENDNLSENCWYLKDGQWTYKNE